VVLSARKKALCSVPVMLFASFSAITICLSLRRLRCL
jgi:hypothetical protein